MSVKEILVCDFGFHLDLLHPKPKDVKWEVFHFKGGLIAATKEEENCTGWRPVRHACGHCGDMIIQVLNRLEISHKVWGHNHQPAALSPTKLSGIFID